MTYAYICDGIRTPFGKYNGALRYVRTDDLASIPIAELLKRNTGIDSKAFDEVLMGCANQSGEDNRNVARMATLLAGLPVDVPAMTLNRLCASGLETVSLAAKNIWAGESDLVIAGGVENMSRSPFVMGKAQAGFDRNMQLQDTTMGWRFINPKMEELYGSESMPKTGENVAEQYGVSRADQDAFAHRSQERAAKAMADGTLAKEICTVSVPSQNKKKPEPTLVSQDEHPRLSSLEVLAKLRPVVKPDGTVTAGNASGINDGAVAMIVASEEAVKKYNLNPIARILGGQAAGLNPTIMGMGPVHAVNKLKDIGVIELNEAFASQSVAVLRELGLPEDGDFINPNGGAIALGHPLGASGARIVLHAALEMQRRDEKYALATMCVGVGQGSALLMERV